MDKLPIRRAILSVTHKEGLVELATFLQQGGVSLFSTGGTRKMLLSSGLKVSSVSDVTNFPEILGGRVKTLHPHIHAGILADKDNPEHLATLSGLDLVPFDLVCVNLYDFEQAAARGLDLKEAVEQIDIGGPTMLRASAKNFHSVAVVADPRFYSRLKKELEDNDFHISLAFRKEMAEHVFSTTARYDTMIAKYLTEKPLEVS